MGQLLIGLLLILSSLGVILAKKPVYSALSFLLTLLLLAMLYLQLSAEFIAVMQVLVYAGAILVMFMFVMVLFQDAHAQMEKLAPKASKPLLVLAAVTFLSALAYLSSGLTTLQPIHTHPSPDFGTVQALGKALYLQFFFPFEAITLLFLIAVIGALYIGRRSA